MADVSITAASVAAYGFNAVNAARAIAGASIAAGQAIYLDASANNAAKVADCEGATAPVAAVEGIALNGAASGQPVSYATSGQEVTIGGTLVAGTQYVLSAAGAIAPVADLATSDYITYLGYATTTGRLKLAIVATGIEK